MVAVELELIGGLGSAETLQARRAVARQHDQRDARCLRFDDGGIVVRSGGAGGADQDDRHARRLRHAQAQEGRPAFVDVDEDAQVGGAAAAELVGGHRQGGRTRSGAHHRGAHAAADQLIEKRRRPQRRHLRMRQFAIHGPIPLSTRPQPRPIPSVRRRVATGGSAALCLERVQDGLELEADLVVFGICFAAGDDAAARVQPARLAVEHARAQTD